MSLQYVSRCFHSARVMQIFAPPTREPVPVSGLQMMSLGDGFFATLAAVGCAAGTAGVVEAGD